MSQFRENLQTDGRMDGRTHPILRSLAAKGGGQKNPQSKIKLLVSIRGDVDLIICGLGL